MSNYLSRLTVIVLALSLGAFSLGCSNEFMGTPGGNEYPRYDSARELECDLPNAPGDILHTRSIMTEESSKKSMHSGWGFFQFKWEDRVYGKARFVSDEGWSEILSKDDSMPPEHLCSQKAHDRYFNITTTTTTTKPKKTTTTKSSINTSQCEADFNRVEDNLYTWDDDLFDRLFRKTLSSCGNRSTWKKYAPSSVSTMLTAGCMLNSSTPVCRS